MTEMMKKWKGELKRKKRDRRTDECRDEAKRAAEGGQRRRETDEERAVNEMCTSETNKESVCGYTKRMRSSVAGLKS